MRTGVSQSSVRLGDAIAGLAIPGHAWVLASMDAVRRCGRGGHRGVAVVVGCAVVDGAEHSRYLGPAGCGRRSAAGPIDDFQRGCAHRVVVRSCRRARVGNAIERLAAAHGGRCGVVGVHVRARGRPALGAGPYLTVDRCGRQRTRHRGRGCRGMQCAGRVPPVRAFQYVRVGRNASAAVSGVATPMQDQCGIRPGFRDTIRSDRGGPGRGKRQRAAVACICSAMRSIEGSIQGSAECRPAAPVRSRCEESARCDGRGRVPVGWRRLARGRRSAYGGAADFEELRG